MDLGKLILGDQYLGVNVDDNVVASIGHDGCTRCCLEVDSWRLALQLSCRSEVRLACRARHDLQMPSFSLSDRVNLKIDHRHSHVYYFHTA